MPKSEPIKKPRLEVLDQLRGFLIITIVIDHLSRFPSIFAILSGKALLWVTAAEGFVGISGFLVGYVRGYKNKDLPFKEVSIKLLRRAVLLYIWSIIASIVFVAIIWYIPLKGGYSSTPMPAGDWKDFLIELFLMHYPYVWVHFLTLYAMFLAVSPIAIWLLRRNLAWILASLSFATLVLGWMTKAEPLQWQFLFFIPAIIGYYLQPLLNWWKTKTTLFKRTIAITTFTLTVITITISVLFSYYGPLEVSIGDRFNTFFFAKDSISLARVIIAFLWFGGYFVMFHALQKYIRKYLNWLLIPIGTSSLTAYILHGIILCVVSYFTVQSSNFWVNCVLGAIVILALWALIKIPIVRKVIPA